MALAKKCDVCGKYYEPYGYRIGSMEVNSIILEACDKTNDHTQCLVSYDLCPNCSDSINRFIDDLKYAPEEV